MGGLATEVQQGGKVGDKGRRGGTVFGDKAETSFGDEGRRYSRLGLVPVVSLKQANQPGTGSCFYRICEPFRDLGGALGGTRRWIRLSTLT